MCWPWTKALEREVDRAVAELDLKRAEALIREDLKNGRWVHTLGVKETAVRLARIHRASEEKAAFAALLHDWAKHAPKEEFHRLVEQGLLPEGKEVLGMPKLYHAYLGAYWIEREFGVSDPEILEAVRYHSTGSPGLGLCGRILFVADYAEPGRELRRTDRIRALAEKDLDCAVQEVLRLKLLYLIENGRPVHPRAVKFWNDLIRRRGDDGFAG